MAQRTIRIISGLAVLAWALLASYGVARADPAEILIREGVELRRQGNDQEALEKFQRAYRIAHSPRAAVQLGLCEQALEKWLDAELHLTEALAAISDPWVGRNRDTIDESLAIVRAKLGLVKVAGTAPGAAVRINGQYVGNLPDPLQMRVLPGEFKVNAQAAGHAPFEEKGSITAGQTISVKVALVPMQRQPLATAPAEVRQVPQEEEAAVDLRERAPDAANGDEKPFYKKPWFWVATGAVVAVGVGVAILASGGTNYPNVNAHVIAPE